MGHSGKFRASYQSSQTSTTARTPLPQPSKNNLSPQIKSAVWSHKPHTALKTLRWRLKPPQPSRIKPEPVQAKPYGPPPRPVHVRAGSEASQPVSPTRTTPKARNAPFDPAMTDRGMGHPPFSRPNNPGGPMKGLLSQFCGPARLIFGLS